MIGVICSSYDKIYQKEKETKTVKYNIASMNDELLNESHELNNEKFAEKTDEIECLIYAINEKISLNNNV